MHIDGHDNARDLKIREQYRYYFSSQFKKQIDTFSKTRFSYRQCIVGGIKKNKKVKIPFDLPKDIKEKIGKEVWSCPFRIRLCKTGKNYDQKWFEFNNETHNHDDQALMDILDREEEEEGGGEKKGYFSENQEKKIKNKRLLKQEYKR